MKIVYIVDEEDCETVYREVSHDSCCEEMEQMWKSGNACFDYDAAYGKPAEIVLCIGVIKYPSHEVGFISTINFCPFCGAKIVVVEDKEVEEKDKREIKFRAWDPDNKQMKDPDWIGNDGHAGTGWECWQETQMDWILMQYTGMKDKDGREIYEGDILKGCGEVDYVVSIPDIYYDFQEWVFEGQMLIVGNIYEDGVEVNGKHGCK